MSRDLITSCHDLMRHQSFGMVNGRGLTDNMAI